MLLRPASPVPSISRWFAPLFSLFSLPRNPFPTGCHLPFAYRAGAAARWVGVSCPFCYVVISILAHRDGILSFPCQMVLLVSYCSVAYSCPYPSVPVLLDSFFVFLFLAQLGRCFSSPPSVLCFKLLDRISSLFLRFCLLPWMGNPTLSAFFHVFLVIMDGLVGWQGGCEND